MDITCKNHTMVAVDTTVPIISRDYYCIHCGYNLRTLSVAGLCPECGHPVNDSLQTDLELKWLHRVRRGFTWLLIAWFFQSLLYLVHGLGYLGNLLSGWYFLVSIYPCMQMFDIVLTILACIGIYRVTAPSIYSRPSLESRSLALVARVCALLGIPMSFIILTNSFIPNLTNNPFVVYLITSILSCVFFDGGYICLALYTGRLLYTWSANICKAARIWAVLLIIQFSLITINMITFYIVYRSRMSGGTSTQGPTATEELLLGVLHWIAFAWALPCVLFALYFFRRCRTILNGILVNWQTSID